MDETIKQLFEFADRLEGMKQIERFKGQAFWKEYPQPRRWDSVAEHCWRLSVLVLIVARRVQQPFNLERALGMALTHDIPEIITGDASPLGSDGTGRDSHAYDPEIKATKDEAERRAAHELFGLLPLLERDQLLTLHQEYESQETFESRVVKALDKIEATLQCLEYRGGHMYRGHLEFASTYGVRGASVDPAVQALADELMRRMRAAYHEFVPVTSEVSV
ncbi:HD domain-containing protein [Candidatus Berkelbacteria bacterium]|nr:HD domain-containing protein [Candidatus Berkelbacteria bacterium]